ncbi:MAG: Uma2 family endonuclease [Aquificota bacterium]|nr:Uma2 family endonuclease [Aquificota bacterium]
MARPEIAVICGKLEEKLRKTPLLIVEIVSPGSERQDEGLKFELYQREGVRNYLLAYPEERTYKYYVLTERGYIRKEGTSIDIGNCTLTLNMEKIWL